MGRLQSIDWCNGAEFDWRQVQAAADLKVLIRPRQDRLVAVMLAEGGPEALVTDRIVGFLNRPGQSVDP